VGQKTVPLLQIVTAVYDDEERRTVYQSVRCFFSGVRLVYLIYLRDLCITFFITVKYSLHWKSKTA